MYSSDSFLMWKVFVVFLLRLQKKLIFRWKCLYGRISEGMGHQGHQGVVSDCERNHLKTVVLHPVYLLCVGLGQDMQGTFHRCYELE